MASQDIYQLKVDDYDRRIIINALNQLKSKQIKEDKTTDAIDDLLLKLIDSKPINRKRNEAR